MENNERTMQGKVLIHGKLIVDTGLHIGTSGDFSPIGAVDSVVVRDLMTQQPMIPGSSLKGKMRYLLAAQSSDTYSVPKIDEEPENVQRLFGLGGKTMRRSRLQFFDLFMLPDSVRQLETGNADLYLTEIKFENTINRTTGIANPRQMERVPRGAEFEFKLIYIVEDPENVAEDFETVAEAFELLQNDYLGMGGSRGNGRVHFAELDVDNVQGHCEESVMTKMKEAIKRVGR